jgi:hypothetical protein
MWLIQVTGYVHVPLFRLFDGRVRSKSNGSMANDSYMQVGKIYIYIFFF